MIQIPVRQPLVVARLDHGDEPAVRLDAHRPEPNVRSTFRHRRARGGRQRQQAQT